MLKIACCPVCLIAIEYLHPKGVLSRGGCLPLLYVVEYLHSLRNVVEYLHPKGVLRRGGCPPLLYVVAYLHPKGVSRRGGGRSL